MVVSGVGLHTFLLIMASVFVVSVMSLVGIVLFLFNDKVRDRFLFVFVSFATGSLLGAAFLDLMPEAIESDGGIKTYALVLLGVIVFFVMEKYLCWSHSHEHGAKADAGARPFTYLNLVGDAIHNFFDGAIIAASFLTSLPVGLVTTVAIIAHEIPQEFGDFSILVYGGFSKQKALFYNYMCAVTAFAGAILAYFFAAQIHGLSTSMLAFAAGGFIYIACSDLIPELTKEVRLKESLQEFSLILSGIGVIWIARMFLK